MKWIRTTDGDKAHAVICEMCPLLLGPRCKRFCSPTCRAVSVNRENAKRRRPEAIAPPKIVDSAWLKVLGGLFALVDADLYDELSKQSWRCISSGYVVDGHGHCLHKLIVANSEPVDHRNGNKLDCRRQNLRPASQLQNTHNSRSRGRFKGVSFHHATGKWRARIRNNYFENYLGLFVTEEAAAHAYDTAARELHGEFACVNFPRSGERGALK